MAKVNWLDPTTRSLKLRKEVTLYFFPKSLLLIYSMIVVLCLKNWLNGIVAHVGYLVAIAVNSNIVVSGRGIKPVKNDLMFSIEVSITNNPQYFIPHCSQFLQSIYISSI